MGNQNIQNNQNVAPSIPLPQKPHLRFLSTYSITTLCVEVDSMVNMSFVDHTTRERNSTTIRIVDGPYAC